MQAILIKQQILYIIVVVCCKPYWKTLDGLGRKKHCWGSVLPQGPRKPSYVTTVIAFGRRTPALLYEKKSNHRDNRRIIAVNRNCRRYESITNHWVNDTRIRSHAPEFQQSATRSSVARLVEIEHNSLFTYNHRQQNNINNMVYSRVSNAARLIVDAGVYVFVVVLILVRLPVVYVQSAMRSVLCKKDIYNIVYNTWRELTHVIR